MRDIDKIVCMVYTIRVESTDSHGCDRIRSVVMHFLSLN